MQMLANLMSILIVASPFAIFAMAGLFWKSSPLKGSTLWILALSVIVTYGLYIGHAVVSQKVADIKMGGFDLDQDGNISTNEETSAYSEALNRWSHDTGRTLAIYFGWFVALTLNGIALCIYWPVVSLLKALRLRVACERTLDR